MEKSQAMQPKASPQGCNPILTLGGRVSQTTTLAVLGVGAVGAGLAFGWDSLAALGLTSIIVGLLPCVLMCAAGICMSRMGRKDTVASAAPQFPSKEAQFPADIPLGTEASAIEKAPPLGTRAH